ncbi:M1 family metallopeptidase [Deinococcus koreensis]|uniref:Aminopeptidase N n=1 Tax=Deinococcus koreensis TaxID=2054903 RepID=A0A2K3UVJ3_9DEIO|nr:M1 family metallopeptidase [Deinococcus koreensis]PNY80547.1 zinc metalloprotease [Deinococcus koreensis]
MTARARRRLAQWWRPALLAGLGTWGPVGAQALISQAGPAQLAVPALPSILAPAANPAQPIGDSIFPALGQAGLDVRHYDLSLQVDQPGTLGLRVGAVLTLAATRPLEQVSLDFLGPAVQEVRWNGQAVAWQQDRAAGKLRITPAAALQPGRTAQLSVRYAGQAGTRRDPELNLSLGWQGVPAGPSQPAANYTFSEPDGARTFLPVNDHPSDPATFTTRITVPRGYVAAASGVLRAEEAVPGGRVFTFEQAQPIPAYALAIHVNQFQTVQAPAVPVGVGGAGVQRRDYFPPAADGTIRAPYLRLGDMLGVLSGWFGPFPFAAHGAAVISPRVPALETATLMTMPLASSFERVIVHETAHQWFGDRVVLGDWADVWLNEGFATYAELLWLESRGENGASVVAAWYERVRDQATRPLVARREGELFDTSAYVRGALALHALRSAVGDDAFRRFLRAYVAQFSTRPVRTADLLAFTRQELGPVAQTVLRVWVESPTLPPLPVLARPAAQP